MTISDYEVELMPKAGGSRVKIVVRASSFEDARRQALSQYPNYTTVATPRKLN
jgi:hypothetical protein